jgi:hypothetical protein
VGGRERTADDIVAEISDGTTGGPRVNADWRQRWDEEVQCGYGLPRRPGRDGADERTNGGRKNESLLSNTILSTMIVYAAVIVVFFFVRYQLIYKEQGVSFVPAFVNFAGDRLLPLLILFLAVLAVVAFWRRKLR